VFAVAKNSVAQEMCIHRFDVILAINNKVIKNANMLSEAISQLKPGKKIKVTFFDWDKLDQVTETGHLR
jgi:S1-C subfamily serine protease